MKRIDFTVTEGFPITMKVFKKLQEGYIQIHDAFLAQLEVPSSGDYILSGCELSGGTYSNGWMAIDGEIMPYTGGANAHVKVITANESVTFEDASTGTVYINKYAQHNVEDSGVTTPIADFIRIGNNVIDYDATSSDHTMTGGVQINKGRVQMSGSVTRTLLTSVATPVLVCTLDEAYRPSVDRMFQVVMHFLNATPELRTIRIRTNGEVYVYNEFQGSETIPLDTISYNI